MISKAAKLIIEGFHNYKSNFDSITNKARIRFENKQWLEFQNDVAQRLYLHKTYVYATVDVIKEFILKESFVERWQDVYIEYSSLIASRTDVELAYTFFSSVTRKIFPTYFQDHNLSVRILKTKDGKYSVYSSYFTQEDFTKTIKAVLKNIPIQLPYPLIEEDALLIGERLEAAIKEKGFETCQEMAIVKSPFFRNKTGYIAGKIILTEEINIPFLIAMVHREGGLQADAVILTSEKLEVIFSFTRSYFCVETESPSSMVNFLQTLMPGKRQAEIYNSLGFNKHGKTLLFNDLHTFIDSSSEKLVNAPGIKGMVMAVFTFPSFHTVFKIIKDEFDPVKTVTRKEVMEKYRLVYKHDRYGRLADTHEFDNLTLHVDDFDPDLLEELQHVGSRSIKVDGQKVLIKHTFTERKMCPLNLFIEQQEEEIVKKVIVDYGNALKELAYANIFPGDLLMKNFGVTRDFRVVFYDYDEITFVTACNFKKIPVPKTVEELYAFQPYYEVKPNDIFPEEFKNYLVPQGPLRDLFINAHPELFEIDFWEGIKQNHIKGNVFEIVSYDKKNCLR